MSMLDLTLYSIYLFDATAHAEIYTLPYTTLFRSVPGGICSWPQGPEGCLEYMNCTCAGEGGCTGTIHILKDRKSTRLNSSHRCTSYAVFCLKKKTARKYLNTHIFVVVNTVISF